MKKIIVTTICMAVVMLMAACGGKNSKNQTSEEKIIEKAIEKAFSGEARSQAAVEHFMKTYGGLKYNDVTPDFKYSTEPEKNNFYGTDREGIARFNFAEGVELTKEDYEIWVRKVYDATKKISDDGINIKGWENADDEAGALSEKDFDEMIKQGNSGFIYLGMYNWGYRLNGQFMRIYMERDEKQGNYSAKITVCYALAKSFNQTMEDAEKALENEDVQKALKDALN